MYRSWYKYLVRNRVVNFPSRTANMGWNFFGFSKNSSSQPSRDKWQYYCNIKGAQHAARTNSLLGERNQKINRSKPEHGKGRTVNSGSSAHFSELENQVFEMLSRILFRNSLQFSARWRAIIRRQCHEPPRIQPSAIEIQWAAWFQGSLVCSPHPTCRSSVSKDEVSRPHFLHVSPIAKDTSQFRPSLGDEVV